MTDKKKLEDVMAQRNPLKRDVVQPVDIYTNPQVEKPSSSHSDIISSPQTKNTADAQVDKDTSPAMDKKASAQANRIDGVLIRKYTTHLPPTMIKAIKQRALDTDRKDYEIMYEAVSRYFDEN